MKITKIGSILLLTTLLAGPAAAENLVLPLDLTWCDNKDNVEFSLENPREVAGEVIESTVSLWGMEGFGSLTFEDSMLIEFRLRFFEDPDSVARSRRALDKLLGDGGESGRKVHWAVEDGTRVTMQIQSEQIVVHFAVPDRFCSDESVRALGLTDQEKADLDDVAKKQAVEWDPYADAADDAPIVDKTEEKAVEEKEKEKEEEEKAAEEIDIDW